MPVHYRTCPFCEATCGLRVETEGDDVVSIRGDEEDVLSHGFICPKAYGLKELHEDPDRLTTPLIRRDGAGAGPGCPRRSSVATASWSRRPGRRRSRRSTGASRRSSRSTAATPRRST